MHMGFWHKFCYSYKYVIFIGRQVLDEYAETENSEAKPAAVENEPVPKSTPPLLRAQLQVSSDFISFEQNHWVCVVYCS